MKTILCFLLVLGFGCSENSAQNNTNNSNSNNSSSQSTNNLTRTNNQTGSNNRRTSNNQTGTNNQTSSNNQIAERHFYMGFTPWPYDATVAAVNDTYKKIHAHGDIVSHHLDGGIPWQELENDSPYSVNVENDLKGRILATDTTKIIFLNVNPLNTERTGIANHWGTDFNEPLLADWMSAKFSDAKVIDAYVKFSLDLIARFNPKYFNCGIEINELMVNSPEKFDAFVIFLEEVSKRIKLQFPTLKIMVSLVLKSPNSEAMIITKNGFEKIRNFVDLVGVSTYGYVFYDHIDKGDPENLPENWLSQIKEIAGDIPIAISETGWIAEDLTIDAFLVEEKGSAQKQNLYVEKLLNEASELNIEFVIWFTVVDFDNLWTGVLGEDDISKIWRDTGLFDEGLNERPALQTWDNWYGRPYVQKN